MSLLHTSCKQATAALRFIYFFGLGLKYHWGYKEISEADSLEIQLCLSNRCTSLSAIPWQSHAVFSQESTTDELLFWEWGSVMSEKSHTGCNSRLPRFSLKSVVLTLLLLKYREEKSWHLISSSWAGAKDFPLLRLLETDALTIYRVCYRIKCIVKENAPLFRQILEREYLMYVRSCWALWDQWLFCNVFPWKWGRVVKGIYPELK